MSTKDRIKAARKSQGLNQSELARQIGTSPQTVQQWEAGKTLPKGLNLLNLANALNVSAEWLQTGKENRSITDVTNNPSDQTSNEAMLLQIFREMTDEQRADILKKAQEIHDSNEKMLAQLLARKKV